MMESHRMIDREVQDLVIFMMGRRERYRADWGGRSRIEYSTYARSDMAQD